MPNDIRNNIYSDIASQFPAVYQENSEFLLAFVEAYYEHLDEKLDRNIPKIKDIDTTLDTFLIFYKRKYLADLPFSADVDIRFILKHIQDLYTRKGSEESLQLVFKMFFNEDIEVIYPGKDVLKPSDSLWRKDTFLEMKPVYSVVEYPIKRGNTIRGDLSGASAFVDDILFINLGGAITPIVYLSLLKGRFTRADAIEVLTATNEGIETIKNVGKLINGSISSHTVNPQLRLPSNQVGDTVDLVSDITGQGAKGVITKINEEEIGSIDYEIEDGGWGYIEPGSFTVENDIGVSNRAIVVDLDQKIDVEPGDTIIFPGSTIDFNGRSSLSTQYSVTGAAKVIAYRHPLLFVETRTEKEDMYNFMSQYYNTGLADINTGETISRNVLFDHMFNGFYQSQPGNTNDPRPLNVPPGYDDILTYIYFKSNEDEDGIMGNFTGPELNGQRGDLAQLQNSVQAQDFQLFYRFQQSINNGINDADLFANITDFDVSQIIGTTIDTYIVDISNLQLDTADRTPTISPYIPTIPSNISSIAGNFNRRLEDLDNGQMYTIINPGTAFSDDDWALIGASKNEIGTDFIFTNENLSDLSNTNLRDNDALFSAYKQVYGRLYQYLTYNELTPNFTIGRTLEAPPTIPAEVSNAYPATDGAGNPLANGSPHPQAGQPDWLWYDAYFVPADQLITGREYYPFTFGDVTYDEWKALGLDLDNAQFSTGARNGNQSNLSPGRTYIVKDIGDTGSGDWELLGTSSNATVGEVFQASATQPTFPNVSHNFDSEDLSGSLINIPSHGFREGDKVEYGAADGGTEATLEGSGSLADGSILYIGVVNENNVSVYTSRVFEPASSVRFGNNVGANNYSLTKQQGSPEVIEVQAVLSGQTVSAFNSALASSRSVPGNTEASKFVAQDTTIATVGNALCVDVKKVSEELADATTVNFNGQVEQVQLGYYNTSGIMTDPMLDDNNAQIDRIPEEIRFSGGLNFIGLINGDFRRPVSCNNIGKFNDSSSFEITAVDEKETVSLVPDIIGDVVLDKIQQINLGDTLQDGIYPLSGTGQETVDTEYRDAFSRITLTLGRISELLEDRPGTDYENDVGVRVVNDIVARFNKKDLVLRFNNSDFSLRDQEVVEQEIILNANAIDEVNGLTQSAITEIPATNIGTLVSAFDQTNDIDINVNITYANSITTFEIEEEKYTAKAKYLKRIDEDFYFRPITFYSFDKDVPINIRAEDRIITSIGSDEDSLPMGANAVILGPAQYDSGQVDEIEMTHTGYKFSDKENLRMINTNPNSSRYDQEIATINIRTLGQGNTSGSWKTKNSFLNEYATRTHDNDYYQEYSYDILSMISPAVYTPLVKNVIGVAGTKMFSTPLINSDSPMLANVDVDIEKYEIATENLEAQGIGSIANSAEVLDGQTLKTSPDGEDIKVIIVTEAPGS